MNKRLLVALFFVVALTSCGNKGPLVLPKKPQPAATEQPPPPMDSADPQPLSQ